MELLQTQLDRPDQPVGCFEVEMKSKSVLMPHRVSSSVVQCNPLHQLVVEVLRPIEP